jgi:hypothetical protein
MFRKFLTLLLLAAAISLSSMPAAQADGWGKFRAGPLRVVTQNLYVGGDILLPLSVPPEDFNDAAAIVIQQILATNYPERAGKLADLIGRDWPHLVGLQEVYIVKICLDVAQEMCLLDQDYLEILLENLNAKWDRYRAVASVTNIDLQNLPAALPDGTPVYVSITDRDVTLAHRFVNTDNVVEANYSVALPVDNVLLPGFSVLRGYTMVDAKVLGREYRFVNTHLEVTGSGSDFETAFRAVQFAQAQELVALLHAESKTQVLVGDFNSDPFDGPFVLCLAPDGVTEVFCPTPYAVLSGANLLGSVYTDTWLARKGPFEFGNTCCQATLLNNPVSQLDERVDQVWIRAATDYVGPPFLRNVRARVIGDEVGDKTIPSGLWPSDHGGVSTRMVILSPK